MATEMRDELGRHSLRVSRVLWPPKNARGMGDRARVDDGAILRRFVWPIRTRNNFSIVSLTTGRNDVFYLPIRHFFNFYLF